MAGSPAINEVEGTSRSQLRGPLEVAGRRADVVIANPNGITCDGCGFVNTGRVGVTTGVPQYRPDGSLQSLTVREGTLVIGGDGLSADDVAQLDLAARGIVVEGQAFTQRLRAIAGANRIDWDSFTPAGQANSGNANELTASPADVPRFAIDVKDLGALRAGEIYLIATDKGLGVNSTGQLAASQADIVIDADGAVHVRALAAARDARITTRSDATLDGASQSGRDTIVRAAGTLTHTGTLDVGGTLALDAHDIANHGKIVQRGERATLTAQGSLASDGSILAAQQLGIDAETVSNTGTIAATDVALAARSLINRGAVQADARLHIAAAAIDNSGGKLLADDTSVLAGSSLLMNRQGVLVGARQLMLQAGALDNTAGTLGTQGVLALAFEGELDNRQGAILAGELSVRARNLRNQGGRLISDGAVRLATAQLDNAGGTVAAAGGTFDADVQTLDNRGGSLAAADRLQLRGGTVDNRDKGRLAAVTSLDVRATQLDNRNGDIAARQTRIDAGRLDNGGGSVSADGLTLAAGSLSNIGGSIVAGDAIDLAAGTFDNTAGKLVGGHSVRARIDGDLDNRKGALAAGGDLTVSAFRIDNRDGLLGSDGSQRVTATDTLANDRGEISAKATLALKVATLDNAGGKVAAGDMLTVIADTVDNGSAGSLLAAGTLGIDAATLRNRGAVAAQSLRVNAAEVDNRSGTVQAVQSLVLQTGALDNTSGTLNGRDTAIAAGEATLHNDHGVIAGAERLTLAAGALGNAAGKIVTGGALRIALAGDLDNRQGTLVSGGALALAARRIDNTEGLLAAAAIPAKAAGEPKDAAAVADAESAATHMADLTLAADELVNARGRVLGKEIAVQIARQLDNAGGTVAASDALRLSAGRLANSAGVISAGQGGDVTIAGKLDNRAGKIVMQGDLALAADSLDNHDGTIGTLGAGSATAVTVAAAIANDGGTLAAQRALTLRAQALDNRGGKIGVAQGKARLAVDRLDNRGGAIGGDSLDVAVTDTFDNRDAGRVLASDALTLEANAIDNRAGMIGTQSGSASVRAATLDNRGGKLGAGDALTVRADVLTNADGGSIVAQQALTVGATALNNRGGVLGSIGGKLSVQADTVDNTGQGVISAADTLQLTARTLDNRGGLLASTAGDISLQSTTLRNGRDPDASTTRADTPSATGVASRANSPTADGAGRILAGRALAVEATDLDNRGGSLGSVHGAARIATQSFDNANGRVAAGTDLTLSTRSLVNTAGVMGAGGDITLAVSGDWTNEGALAAGNNLSLQGATLTNAVLGKLSAGNRIEVRAGALRNDGVIEASVIDIAATGSLTNSATGVIDGSDTQVSASLLDNTGRIYGDALRVGGATNASAVRNHDGGVIAAREKLLIGATTLDNTAGGQLLSLGDLAVGGGFDANRALTGSMDTLRNASSLIQSAGSMQIATRLLENRNDALQVRRVTSPAVTTQWVQLANGDRRYPAGDCLDRSFLMRCKIRPDQWTERTPLPRSTEQVCRPNGDSGDQCEPAHVYAWNDPAFAQLKVDPGPPSPVTRMSDCYNGDFGPDQECLIKVDAWRATLAKLDAAIDKYNADIAYRNEQARSPDYTVFTLVKTESHDEVLASDPGRILAGGNIVIQGDLINRDSHVVAGGALGVTGKPQNIASLGVRTIDYTGSTSQYFWVDSGGGFNGGRSREITPAAPYVQAPEITRTPLAAVRFESGVATGNAPAVPAATEPAAPVEAVATGARIPTIWMKEIDRQIAVSDKVVYAPVRADLPTVPTHVSSPQGGLPVPVVRTVTAPNGTRFVFTPPQLTLPDSPLFTIKRNPGAQFLVETDPRFTSRQAFLGSDYLQQALQRDPARQLKRYGDGFIEQQLVNDQILTLTGRRFLSGYASTEDEFRALMDHGATFAQAVQLTSGVALTAAQMAQLTTDIVWLVAQDVALSDGSVEHVLVPQVYLRQPGKQDWRVQADGSALLSAATIDLQSPQDIVNSGRIQGDAVRTEAARDIDNGAGRIVGASVWMKSANDINNLSGSIVATGTTGNNGALTLLAGRDIVLDTETITSATVDGSSTRTTVGRAATLIGGDITMKALRNVTGAGAVIRASNDLDLQADGAVRLTSAEGRYQFAGRAQGPGTPVTEGRTAYLTESDTTHTVGDIAAGRNLRIHAKGEVDTRGTNFTAGPQNPVPASAGQSATSSSATPPVGTIDISGSRVTIAADVDSRAADLQQVAADRYNRVARSSEALTGGQLQANGAIRITATEGDVTLRGAQVTSVQDGVDLDAAGKVSIGTIKTRQTGIDEHYLHSRGFLSSSTEQSRDTYDLTQSNGTSISGKTVHMKGDAVDIKGSAVVADKNVTIDAAHDVTIDADSESLSQTHYARKEESGLMSGGGAITYGNRKQTQNDEDTATRSAGSQLGSLTGNVIVVAGGVYRQAGSVIQTPQGDVIVKARRIETDTTTETRDVASAQHFEQSGLTVGISNGIVDGAQGIARTVDAAGRTKDTRFQALAAATAGMQAAALAQSVAADPAKAADVRITVSLGHSESSSTSSAHTRSAAGSAITAGGNVVLIAEQGTTVDGQPVPAGAGSISIRGSSITAGGKAILVADRDITVDAAENTYSERSNNSSSGSAIGVSYGAASGLGVSASTSKSAGHGNADDTTWTHSVVKGGTVSAKAGGTLTLRGGTLEGDRVIVDAQALIVQSVQDTSTVRSEQKGSGAGFSASANGFSANVSTANSHANADYKSVTQISGIKAGDGGFAVDIAGAATLAGGVITSTERAVQQGNNSFKSETLTMTDLVNSASLDASASSAGIGISNSTAGTGTNTSTNSTAGYGSAHDSQKSVTRAGISGIAGDTSVRSEKDTSHALQKPDAVAAQGEVAAQAEITAAFAPLAVKAWGDFADKKAQALQASDPEEAKKWAEGGEYRVAGHAVLGGVAGGVGGALGAGAAAAAAPYLNDLQHKISDGLSQSGVSPDVAWKAAGVITQTGATVVGGAVGGGAGAAAGFNVDANNRQLHPDEKPLAKQLAAKSNGKFTAEQIEGQMRGMTANRNGVTEQGAPDTVVGGVPATDKGGTWVYAGTTADGKPILTQQLDPANAEIRAFIASNTPTSNTTVYPGDYPLPPTATPSKPLVPAPEGTRRIPMAVDGAMYQPLVAECPAGGCANGSPIATAIPDAGTKAYLDAVDRKVEKTVNVVTAVTGAVGAIGRALDVVAETVAASAARASGAAVVPGAVGDANVARAGIRVEEGVAREATGLDWTRISARTGGDASEHVTANHGTLSLTKPNQGVFYGNPIATIEDAWVTAQQNGVKPITIGNRDIYVVPRQNSGYAGGMGGQLENYGHVTIITETGTNRVVTGYPSGATPPIPKGYQFQIGNQ